MSRNRQKYTINFTLFLTSSNTPTVSTLNGYQPSTLIVSAQVSEVNKGFWLIKVDQKQGKMGMYSLMVTF